MKDLSSNMVNIFDKLNDMKDLFKFGERIVPIIQSLIEFMKEIVPLLENINTSIAESANKMPQAANQISNVTSATELATTEILDLADNITNELSTIENQVKSFFQRKTERTELLQSLRTLIAGNDSALKLLDDYLALDDSADFEKTTTSELSSISNSIFEITLSLQVQDITTQQLAAVNHLMESVHVKLASLISEIDGSDIRNTMGNLEIQLPEGVHFDANARYTEKEGKQEKVDDIINNQRQQASQDEIDKLFS